MYLVQRTKHTQDMPGLCGGLLRFFDMTVERWTKAASTMALPSALISCSSWHKIHVTTCLLSLPPARHRRGPTHTRTLSHELGLRSKEREIRGRHLEANVWSVRFCSVMMCLCTCAPVRRRWRGRAHPGSAGTTLCSRWWSVFASLTSEPWSSPSGAVPSLLSSSVPPYPCPAPSTHTHKSSETIPATLTGHDASVLCFLCSPPPDCALSCH